MYYGSGTVDRNDWSLYKTADVPEASARHHESMTSYQKTKIRLRQWMRVCLKNNPAKFRPNRIWNDRALGFFEDRQTNKMSKKG